MQNKEIEYKFTVSEEDIPLIESHPILSRYTDQPPKEHYLQAVYFDTQNEDLRRKGYVLRIRRFDELLTQTLKKDVSCQGPEKGLHQRLEWNWVLLSPELDVDLLPGDIKAELALFLPKLQPIFTGEFKRKIWQLNVENDTQIECSIDQGILAVSEQTLPICELELELKAGQPEVLDEVVLRLQKDVPLSPESKSKAYRGYMLYQNAMKGQYA
jgi:triphosphatase